MKQVKNQISSRNWEKTFNEVWDQVWDQAWDQVTGHVEYPLNDMVDTPVHNHIWQQNKERIL